MSRVKERHAHYYLKYAQSHPGDWAWFDREWPQIRRAWEWIHTNGDSLIAHDYIEHLSSFLQLRGLWSEALTWAEWGLANTAEHDDQVWKHVDIGNVYEKLGQLQQASESYLKALTLIRGRLRAVRQVKIRDMLRLIGIALFSSQRWSEIAEFRKRRSNNFSLYRVSSP